MSDFWALLSDLAEITSNLIIDHYLWSLKRAP